MAFRRGQVSRARPATVICRGDQLLGPQERSTGPLSTILAIACPCRLGTPKGVFIQLKLSLPKKERNESFAVFSPEVEGGPRSPELSGEAG